MIEITEEQYREATQCEKEAIDAAWECGSYREAAKRVGISYDALAKRISSARLRTPNETKATTPNDELYISEEMVQYGTEKQKEAALLYIESGSAEATGQKLGITGEAVWDRLIKLKRKAAKHGLSPEHKLTNTIPPGHSLKGISVCYDVDNKPVLTWLKTNVADENYLESMRDAMEAFTEQIRGKSELIPPPKNFNSKLMTTYEIADPHLGMYALMSETGNDYDLEIGERLLCQGIERMIHASPNSDIGVVEILGDFFHVDNNKGITPKHGHILDVDTRFSEILNVGIRASKHIIELGLTKHKKVKVIVAIGNHDEHTSLMLSYVLDAYYDNNPRVDVVLDPCKFHYYTHGSTLIGITHADTVKKLSKLAQIMATDVPELWGQSKHRYFHTAHKHSKQVIEEPGCIIETFSTLSGRDNWTHNSGYRSSRTMTSIVYHKDYGEVERHSVDISMLE